MNGSACAMTTAALCLLQSPRWRRCGTHLLLHLQQASSPCHLLVCKRFRVAALRAITRLSARVPSSSLHLALDLLPLVTALSLAYTEHPLDLSGRHRLLKLT